MMDYSKPLYIFVLATEHNHWDFDLNRILKDPLPPANDPSCIRPCITGSSLALGCWDQPKEAVPSKDGYYVFIVNNEIEPESTFKWVDLSGQYDPSIRDDSGRAWEAIEYFENRVFNIGRPKPGEAGACLCMSWGDPEGKVLYFPLPHDHPSSEPQSPVSEDQITPQFISDSELSPTTNGPSSPGADSKTTPKRELIPDRKKDSSGRRTTRKRMGDSFRRARKSIGNLFGCTTSRAQDD